MAAASVLDQETEEAIADLNRQLIDCDRRLANYRALLDKGADVRVVAGWIRDVETERLGVQARTRSLSGRQGMSAEEIATMGRNLGDLVAILSDADPIDKIRVYERLGLHLTYNIGANAVDVEVQTLNGPGINARSAGDVHNSCVRGPLDTLDTPARCAIWCKFHTGAPFRFLKGFST